MDDAPKAARIHADEYFRKGVRSLGQSSHPAIAKIDNTVCRVLKYIAWVSAVCLIAIMFVAFFNVLGEKLRGVGLPVSGIPASTEIIQYLHIPVVYLAAAYVTLDRGHTRIDLLSAKFPKIVQKCCTVIGDILGLGVCGLIAWRGFIQMGKFIARHKMSSVSGVGFALWPFALIMSVGYILLALSLIFHIIREVSGYSDELAEQAAAAEAAKGEDQEVSE